MSKNKLRTTTKQPGVYKNNKTGKPAEKRGYANIIAVISDILI